jgi:hypothetical protein
MRVTERLGTCCFLTVLSLLQATAGARDAAQIGRWIEAAGPRKAAAGSRIRSSAADHCRIGWP